MSFALMNAPSKFQRTMDCIVDRLEFASVYISDVVIFSENLDKHVRNVRHLLDIVAAHVLMLKITKYPFSQPNIELLGNVVGETGKKNQANRENPVPATITQIWSFFGLAITYIWLINGFPETSSSFHAAQSVQKKLSWSEEMNTLFEELKISVTSPHVLAFPDFDKPSKRVTDASWKVSAI